MPSTLVPFMMTSALISMARSAAAVSVLKEGLPGRAVHHGRGGGVAGENVAAADDDGGLDTHALNLGDIPGDLRRHGRVDAVGLLAHQGFAGKFEEDAFVRGPGRGGHEQRLY